MAPSKTGLNARGYFTIADIIKHLPADIRQTVADHFATELNFRTESFDAGYWRQVTGGRVLSTEPPSEIARKARVAAHRGVADAQR